MTGAALWDGRRVGVPCDTPEWAAGGCPGGKDGSIHKGPLRDCRLGTRLALVLLPFHGMAGGGCCLVLTEWRDYSERIGERRFIITMLQFLQSVDGHYVRFCTYTTVLCDLPHSLIIGCCVFLTTITCSGTKLDLWRCNYVSFDSAVGQNNN